MCLFIDGICNYSCHVHPLSCVATVYSLFMLARNTHYITTTTTTITSKDVGPLPTWDAAVPLAMHVQHFLILNFSWKFNFALASQPSLVCVSNELGQACLREMCAFCWRFWRPVTLIFDLLSWKLANRLLLPFEKLTPNLVCVCVCICMCIFLVIAKSAK